MTPLRTLAAAALLLALPLAAASSREAEPQRSIWTVNTVKAKPGMVERGRRYFEAKWLPARALLVTRGAIASYKLLLAPAENQSEAEFVLITEYPDAARYAAREANFQQAFREIGAPDQVTVDGLTRAELFETARGLEDYAEVAGGSATGR
jgi:hypothetical protein